MHHVLKLQAGTLADRGWHARRDTDHVGIVLVDAHVGEWVEASHEAVAHVAVEKGERVGGVLASLHRGDLLRW